MLKLIIEDDEGRKTVVPFVREEITIGRQEGNTIRLTERNVSRRHARLLRQNGHVVVEDLGSSNGTRINGERISGQSAIKDGDLLQIGDYDLALQNEAALAASKAASSASSASSRPTLPAAPALRGSEEPSDPNGSATEAETELETPVQDEASGPSTGPEGRRHSTSIIRMDQVESTRTRKVQELDAAQAPRLVVVSSELKGQEFSCLRTEMRVGRTDDNDIVIDHRSLSRTHAKIVREDNGEWRVIDMQSANGMTINGESYAQATLNGGDIIELGHVKLRFVGPGESSAASGKGFGKVALFIGLGLLVVGGGVFFFLAGPSDIPPAQPIPVTEKPSPPPVKNEPPPAQEEPPPETQTPEQVAAPVEPKPTPVPPPPTPPAGPTAAELAQQKLTALIQEAQQALNAGNLEKAEDTLGKTRKDGKLPPEAQEVASVLDAEKKADKALREGQLALKNKRYDEVDRQLALAQNSTLFAKSREDLATALAKVREAQAKAEPKPLPTVPVKPPPSAPGPSTPSAQEQARAAYSDAVKLFKARQIDSAVIQGKKCVELDSSNGECHMVLGAAYATLKDMTKAAEHYRQFLKLAPDHKQAPKVKKSLEEYESQNPNR
ncbi:FHA domain-containing protein [Stigmatella sp. ncwal1]|uniref:FHA domain-containing protein n=1 Tax=Stigmatella ashevillensis TaxID=2995309 RepID=A0ABT5D7D2_9BACT|nr:FHA domain-containing protein [Stigmatella ashevillena]MDC0709572.1 FHA domain-containing protein [Stigmatella ashevillena]